MVLAVPTQFAGSGPECAIQRQHLARRMILAIDAVIPTVGVILTIYTAKQRIVWHTTSWGSEVQTILLKGFYQKRKVITMRIDSKQSKV
jgi:hypothetical protein